NQGLHRNLIVGPREVENPASGLAAAAAGLLATTPLPAGRSAGQTDAGNDDRASAVLPVLSTRAAAAAAASAAARTTTAAAAGINRITGDALETLDERIGIHFHDARSERRSFRPFQRKYYRVILH